MGLGDGDGDGDGAGVAVVPGRSRSGSTSRGEALAAGRGVARGVGVGVGAGAGVGSPKPGGRIDSGLSWLNAGIDAPASNSAIAPSATSARQILKRHGLFDLNRGLLGIATGQKEQPANDDDQDEQENH